MKQMNTSLSIAKPGGRRCSVASRKMLLAGLHVHDGIVGERELAPIKASKSIVVHHAAVGDMPKRQ
jgi:hypothetical protein